MGDAIQGEGAPGLAANPAPVKEPLVARLSLELQLDETDRSKDINSYAILPP